MTSAVDRLAAELMKLSDEEWIRVTERWIAGHDWHGVFGPAWEEISERLCDVEREAGAGSGAGETLPAAARQAAVNPADRRGQ